jgi:CRP-like cAMP-binding protein
MPSLSLFHNDPTSATFPEGHRFFDVGESGNTMFVVLDGEVDLSLRGVTLETVKQGGFFGEMALIDKKERSATAVAKTPVQAVQVDQRRFLYLVQNTPFFAIEIMAVMADRLRRADAMINPAR